MLCTKNVLKKSCFAPKMFKQKSCIASKISFWTNVLLCIQRVSAKAFFCIQTILKTFALHPKHSKKLCFAPKMFEKISFCALKCLNKSLALHQKCLNNSLALHPNCLIKYLAALQNVWTKFFFASMSKMFEQKSCFKHKVL